MRGVAIPILWLVRKARGFTAMEVSLADTWARAFFGDFVAIDYDVKRSDVLKIIEDSYGSVPKFSTLVAANMVHRAELRFDRNVIDLRPEELIRFCVKFIRGLLKATNALDWLTVRNVDPITLGVVNLFMNSKMNEVALLDVLDLALPENWEEWTW